MADGSPTAPSGGADRHPDADEVLDVVLGHASEADRQRAVEHLRGCPACHRLHAELSEGLEDALAAVPRQAPPAGFETAVVAALQEAGAIAGESPPPPARHPRWASVLAVAAGVVLGVVIGAGGAQVLLPDPDPSPGTPTAPASTPATPAVPAGVIPLVTADGDDVGSVARAIGEAGPRWVVTVQAPAPGRSITCRVTLADGTVRDLASWPVGYGGRTAWVMEDPGPDARSLDLVDDADAVWATARF